MHKAFPIKITIIYDNSPAVVGLNHGWGFSCLLEFKDKKIIFDTGGDKVAFFRNIQKLNIQLDTITHLVFSHQHWDHTAGFAQVIKRISNTCKIYVPFKFDAKLLSQIPNDKNLNLIKDVVEIEDDVFLIALKGRSCDIKECFSVYEQSLIINRPIGSLVLTGCAHPGIKNILKAVQGRLSKDIDWVIGGFHLHRSFNRTIGSVIEEFNSLSVQHVAPCHCTGQKAIDLFKDRFFNETHEIGTGSSFFI